MSSANGVNSWFYDAYTDSTIQIGLTGTAFTGTSGYQVSQIDFQCATGHVAGASARLPGMFTDNGANTWVFDPESHTTVQTGLVGPMFTGSLGFQYSQNDFQSAAAHVAGASILITGVDTFNGANTWEYDPVSHATVQTGLTGAMFTGSSGYQYSVNYFQNSAGQVAGSSTRITGVDSGNGYSAWVYNPSNRLTTEIGFTGAGYTSNDGYQESFCDFQSDEGYVAGTSYQVTDGAWSGGLTTWLYNPMNHAIVRTGLAGGPYTGSDGYSRSENDLLNATGQVAGHSEDVYSFNANQHTWVCDPATHTTVRTGLTGGQFEVSGRHYSVNNFQNDAGQIAGYSAKFAANGLLNGQCTWVYSPVTHTIVQTGLAGPAHVGSGGYQWSENVFQNAAGQVLGVTQRIPGASLPRGANYWAYNPITRTTSQIGLIDGAHTGSDGYQVGAIFSGTRPGVPDTIGVAVGMSMRITGVDTWNGRNVWVYNYATNATIQTGLTDAAHTGSSGYQDSEYLLQNTTGALAGYSTRIAGVDSDNGRDVWYYDAITNQTFSFAPSVRVSDSFAYSTPVILNDDGSLLGIYTYFAGGVGTGEQRAFVFRPDLGFADLGALVNGGLAASGWRALSSPAYSASVGGVVGYGCVNGQFNGQSAFVMSVAPTPMCSADLGGQGGAAGPDGVLDNNDFIVFIDAFFAGNPAADFGATGGVPGPDGHFDNNDFVVFIDRFFAGC